MDKKAVIALLLCGLVLVVHLWFIAPYLSPKTTGTDKGKAGDNVTTTAAGAVAKTSTDNGTVKPPTPPPAPPTPTGDNTTAGKTVPTPAAPAAAPSAETAYLAADQDKIQAIDNITLKNALLTSTWTNQFTGACLDVTFNDYYTNVKREKKLTLVGGFESVITPEGERKPAAMALEFPELQKTLSDMRMNWSVSGDNIIFTGRILRKDLKTGVVSDFLDVRKIVSPVKDRYELAVTVVLTNLTDNALAVAGGKNFRYDLRALEGIRVESGTVGGTPSESEFLNNASGRIGLLSEKGFPMVPTETMSSLVKAERLQAPWTENKGNVLCAGIDDRYFAAIAFADRHQTMESAVMEPIKVRLLPKAQPVDTVRVKLTSQFPLAPRATDTRSFRLFVGPKKSTVLEQYAVLGFPNLLDYGIFGFIAIGIVWLLRGLYFIVYNYGVAILIMTVIIRVLLHPLTKKSQVAMARMQRLQPKIKELQKKYKGDKKKLGEEQMKLFREQGVSPLSGCLPMLLQIPILFALYKAFQLAFELRQSPFAGWISDLSLPDTIGHFPDYIPLFGGAAVNVLPVLMAVAMFLQQRMMPKSPDPQAQQQQKIMMFMPFLFVFFFYSMASGLTLYWTVSTILGMGEQYYITKHINAMPDTPAKA